MENATRWICPQVEEQQATDLFERYSLWQRVPFLSHRDRRKHLGLVWLPHYRVTVSWTSARDVAGECKLQCLVCGSSGMPSMLVAELELASAAPPATPSNPLQPRLSINEALALGRQYLVKALQVARTGSVQTIESTTDPAIWSYPCWVETFEKRSGQFDLRVLDAVTAKKGGAGMRQAVLRDILRDPRDPLKESCQPEA